MNIHKGRSKVGVFQTLMNLQGHSLSTVGGACTLHAQPLMI